MARENRQPKSPLRLRSPSYAPPTITSMTTACDQALCAAGTPSLLPPVAPTDGGTMVTLSGTNFGHLSAPRVVLWDEAPLRTRCGDISCKGHGPISGSVSVEGPVDSLGFTAPEGQETAHAVVLIVAGQRSNVALFDYARPAIDYAVTFEVPQIRSG